MNCQTSQEQVSQLLDNELPQESLQPLFQHLGECEECRNIFVQTKIIHDGVKNVGHVSAPKEIDEKFAVLGMERQQSILSRKFTISVSSAFLSGVLLFMISIMAFVLFDKSIDNNRLTITTEKAYNQYLQHGFEQHFLQQN